jgi:environmental stress-induced protein Ves
MMDLYDKYIAIKATPSGASLIIERIGPVEVLRYGDLIDVPWKNGGGITRNIALATCGAVTAWRLSRADVAQDGAFSSFAGLERILTVVSNTGMTLEHPSGVLSADPWKPVHFRGDLDVFSRLKDGPLTDLNLMFDPKLCDGSVVTLRGPLTRMIDPLSTGITALHVLAGQPTLGAETLNVGDTAFIDAESLLCLANDDSVLEITIRYFDQSNDIKFCIAVR